MAGEGRLAQVPVVDGVLFSRGGLVHRNVGLITQCGNALPERRATVNALQAQVHKLTLCTDCYPFVNKPKQETR